MTPQTYATTVELPLLPTGCQGCCCLARDPLDSTQGSAAAQGRVASIVPATQPSESLLTIAMDPGFPSLDLMTTNATLLGIPYDDATGETIPGLIV